MKFYSKAETLEKLSTLDLKATVLPQFRFTVGNWKANPESVLNRFFSNFDWSKQALVVRSSGLAEDSQTESLAGHFDSVINITGQVELRNAINQVQQSFDDAANDDQIFIQPMLTNVRRCGVMFNIEPSSLAPYYVINFSESGDTDNVTSGVSNESLIYVAKSRIDLSSPPWVMQLIELCQQLENLFENATLDIEFAFDEDGKLYLFQVRPLVVEQQNVIPDIEHEAVLKQLHDSIKRMTKPHPYLNGSKSVLGVMPDWNPAEIIGIRPKPLALSLYKELVTNSTWAYQRNNYGYKNLRSFPLLVSLGGLPYIDVRVSFNSFIPADIDNDLAEKLVNYYISQLEESPEKHDKVEFDIIFSCFTLDLKERLSKLKKYGFSNDELETLSVSLCKLTNNIINPKGLWVKDIEKIEQLPTRRKKILESDLSKTEKVYWLLEDCKRYGTLPFAGLARAGFIAVQFLQSMITEGILAQKEYDEFMESLETVSSNMSKDKTELSFTAFLKKYGHLRPGTYDILSPRYDQEPSKYFSQDEVIDDIHESTESKFALGLSQLERIKSFLEENGIDHDVISLFSFIKGAIEGREYAKFVFTRSLSDAMLLMEEIATDLKIDKESLAYADVKAFYEAYSSSTDVADIINESILTGRRSYEITKSIILPPLIVNPNCVYCFEVPENEPNFITMKQTIAELTSNLDETKELKNKIAFIPSADPGFDWLFSHNIAGLVTKFGGANSHMAIRAGELGIPSVIGAGEVLYEKWKKAKLLHIDSANKKVEVLK